MKSQNVVARARARERGIVVTAAQRNDTHEKRESINGAPHLEILQLAM